MSAFNDAMHVDAMAAHGFQHPYHLPQGNHLQDRQMDRINQGYLHDETTMQSNDYINSNGFFAPPQAPRLSAAAARASSMAAMYYNPTLHPMHPMSSHVGGFDPWAAASCHPGDFSRHSIPASAYHHQQIEYQLMAQNNRGLGNQAGYSSAASAYGVEQNQPDQYGHRYSYPHDRSQISWNQAPPSSWAWKEAPANQTSLYQRHLSDATPTGVSLNQGNSSYFNYAKQPAVSTTNNHSHSHSHSQSLSLPAPAHMQETSGRNRNATYRDGWSASGSDWRHVYPNDKYEGTWQGRSGWGEVDDKLCTWNEELVKPAGEEWVPQALASHAEHSTMTQPQAYDPRCESYSDANTAVNAVQEQVERRVTEGTLPQIQPVEEKTTAAPEPPSPETLDKSSVPVSSVGAEIIWSASAVFLEPELLQMCGNDNEAEVRAGRSRCPSTASLTSSGKYTPFLTESDWAPSPMQLSSDHRRSMRGTPTSQSLQRVTFGNGEAAASSEESSASSSEPGTPPSTFPAYMYDEANRQSLKYAHKSKSFRKSRELQGLGLAAPDLTFAINRQLKDSASSLERKSATDRVQDNVSSVLGLVSSDCRWSVFEDKFSSLSQSLREGASQEALQRTTRTNNGNNKSHNTGRSLSPRSDDSPSSNSAPITGSESSPAFRRFAHQVLAQTLVSPTAFMLAIMYSLRVPHLAIQTNNEGVAELDAEAREIFANPPSAAPFKLFTLGLMIANKHLDDNTFLNKTWNEVTGISLSEINRMERWFLEKTSYEISVPEDSWVTFLRRLASRTDAKLMNIGNISLRASSRSANLHSSTTANTKTLGGLTHEEALKRMLLSVEDALVSLGRIAPFDLSQQIRSVSPMRSLEQGGSTIPSLDNYHTETRSDNPLQSLHHDCRSAPSLALYQNSAEDSDLDVFGDEVGPYRPPRDSIRSTLRKDRHSVDPIFNRSMSDDTTSLTWKQKQQQQISPLDIHKKMSDRGAPLAPSVLLDLLNRGQHLAHTAH